MRAAGCDHGIENRCSMCGLIWLPRPSDEAALRRELQVVGDRSPASSGCGRTRPRSPVRRARAARCACAASSSGKNGSWLVSAVRRRRSRGLERRARSPIVVERPTRASRRPSRPRSTAIRSSSRARTLPRIRFPVTPPRYRRSVSFAPPWSLSPSSCSSFKECPLAFRFSYLERLPEPPSPWPPRARSCTGRSSCSSTGPADERTLDAALADLGAGPGRARAPPRLRRPRAHRRGVGASSTPTPSRWCASTSSSRTRAPSAHRPGAQARGRPRPHPAAGHHRPARARRGRRVRRHRLQDRLGAVASSGRRRASRGVHMYALLCERMLGRRPARVQLLYLSKPEAIIATPTEQSIRGVERRTVGDVRRHRHRLQPRRLPAEAGSPVRLLHASSPTAPRTAATRSTPPSCAAPAR